MPMTASFSHEKDTYFWPYRERYLKQKPRKNMVYNLSSAAVLYAARTGTLQQLGKLAKSKHIRCDYDAIMSFRTDTGMYWKLINLIPTASANRHQYLHSLVHKGTEGPLAQDLFKRLLEGTLSDNCEERVAEIYSLRKLVFSLRSEPGGMYIATLNDFTCSKDPFLSMFDIDFKKRKKAYEKMDPDSAYTVLEHASRTGNWQILKKLLSYKQVHPEHPEHVGRVVQAAIYRFTYDVVTPEHDYYNVCLVLLKYLIKHEMKYLIEHSKLTDMQNIIVVSENIYDVTKFESLVSLFE
jgi:hypothetical protein